MDLFYLCFQPIKEILIGFTEFIRHSISITFMPAYAYFGGWGSLEIYFSRPLATLCAFYWLFPFAKPNTRFVSFTLMLVHIYLSNIPYIFPWYISPATFLSIYVLAGLLSDIHALAATKKNKYLWLTQISVIAAIAVFSVSLYITLADARALRWQQSIVEDGHRKQIGLWLKSQAASIQDTVYLEPLGYIGFYSQLKMYDYPGLSSPEVVAARRKILPAESPVKLIKALSPDWLVLRPIEEGRINTEDSGLLVKAYSKVKTFDVSDKLNSLSDFPGKGYLYYDQTFVIYRKIN